MATTFHLRKITGAACGPGTRQQLTPAQGTKATTQTLDATGDTWNITATAFTGTTYGPGTWTGNIFLANTGFGDATANLIIAHYSAACSEIVKLVDEDLAIVGSSYVKYIFSDTAPQIYLANGDLIMGILTEVSGTVEVEYEQTDLDASNIVITDVVTVRPYEYYRRNRRRRSA